MQSRCGLSESLPIFKVSTSHASLTSVGIVALGREQTASEHWTLIGDTAVGLAKITDGDGFIWWKSGLVILNDAEETAIKSVLAAGATAASSGSLVPMNPVRVPSQEPPESMVGTAFGLSASLE